VGWNEIFHGCIVVVLQQLTKQLAHSQIKTSCQGPISPSYFCDILGLGLAGLS
jgi:hypothetical protein